MVQYSNRAKTCQQSEKDGTVLKECQNLSREKKRYCNSQAVPKPANSQKKMLQYSNSAKTCHQAEKDGTILKQFKKPVTSQKKRVQYSNRAKTCKQSKKDGAILQQCQNLLTVRKRWYNTQIEPKPVTSQKKM